MRIDYVDWDGSDPVALAAEMRAATRRPEGLGDDVRAVVEAVRAGGDQAAVDLGERFDGVRVERLVVAPEEVERLAATVPTGLRAALEVAAANVGAVALAQVRDDPIDVEPGQGQSVRVAEVPVGSAGIYVPGGRAPYPSTALMGAISARCAGVPRVVIASPPGPAGTPDPTICAAAQIAGVDEIYALGGAQAIAALAHGTESIAPVDVIAGPGGPWVQEAKLAVSGRVGIDGYAGPSELALISDGTVSRQWLALDLCAQAEHGEDGLLVALALAAEDAAELGAAIEAEAAARDGIGDARVSILSVDSLDHALALCEALAPEHLQLCCDGAETLAAGVRTAGCVLVGGYSATAFGDYAAGSNHVLPTGGAGRFTGPLGPATFRRRISIVRMNQGAAVELGAVVATIASAEGFPVHAASATARASEAAPPPATGQR